MLFVVMFTCSKLIVRRKNHSLTSINKNFLPSPFKTFNEVGFASEFSGSAKSKMLMINNNFQFDFIGVILRGEVHQ